MKWFRNWLAALRGPRPALPCSSARPRLEALEGRNLMNVSSAFDAAGNITTLMVLQSGELVQYGTSTGFNPLILVDPSTGAPPVRVAHAYRDQNGLIGMDVVYQSGLAFEYDSTHALFMGDQILDLSRAWDNNGNFKLDVLYTTAAPPFGPDLRGTLVEYTSTSVTTLSANARWATAYLDANGGLGIAVGIFASNGNLVAFRNDSIGNFLLYNSPDGATQDITDYGQTIDPTTGAVWSDITFGRFAGTYAIESRPTGQVTIGDGMNIRIGG
jgi:hypothetical protein